MKRKFRCEWISWLLRAAVTGSALLCGMLAVLMTGFLVWNGCLRLWLPGMSGCGQTEQNAAAAGWIAALLPPFWNTLLLIAAVLLLAVPLGTGTAVFLSEYAGRGSRLAKAVSLAVDTLAGIPSILFGLFGFLVFVLRLGWGYSFLAGACTLTLMILPLMIRTTQEALRSIPDALRENSYGLGAGRGRTVLCVLLPAAFPGMLAGILLAIGRISGESAALLFTAGTGPEAAESLFSSAATLAVYLYAGMVEGQSLERAYQAALLLLLLTGALNLCASLLTARFAAGAGARSRRSR